VRSCLVTDCHSGHVVISLLYSRCGRLGSPGYALFLPYCSSQEDENPDGANSRDGFRGILIFGNMSENDGLTLRMRISLFGSLTRGSATNNN
jgi:hypothetical protein